jgi:hypothetical protein
MFYNIVEQGKYETGGCAQWDDCRKRLNFYC